MFFVSVVLRFIVNRDFGQTFLLNLGFDPGRLESYYMPTWNGDFGNIRNFSSWLNAFFPISRASYGFFSRYCAMYLFAPFLNKFLRTLSKKQYHYLLAISSLTVSILPTLFYTDFLETNATGGFIWAIYIYIVAGYLRLHFDVYSVKRKNYLITFFAMILIRTIVFISLDNGICIDVNRLTCYSKGSFTDSIPH